MYNDNLFVIIKFDYKRTETYCLNKHSNIINTTAKLNCKMEYKVPVRVLHY